MTPVLMFPSAWLSTGAFLDAAYVAINWSIYAIFFGLVPHEYGHAAVAKFVGIRHSTIHLFGIFGVWQPDDEKSMLQLSSMQRIMICMAGPLTNLLIAGLFLLIAFWTPWASFDLLQHIIAVSLFIGLLNLFPLWPLDGGQVLFEQGHDHPEPARQSQWHHQPHDARAV